MGSNRCGTTGSQTARLLRKLEDPVPKVHLYVKSMQKSIERENSDVKTGHYRDLMPAFSMVMTHNEWWVSIGKHRQDNISVRKLARCLCRSARIFFCFPYGRDKYWGSTLNISKIIIMRTRKNGEKVKYEGKIRRPCRGVEDVKDHSECAYRG